MNQKSVTEKKIKHTEAPLLLLFNFSESCMADQKEESNEIRGFIQLSRTLKDLHNLAREKLGRVFQELRTAALKGH